MTDEVKKEVNNEEEKHGFFLGFWHGMIAPYKLFGLLFGSKKIEFFKQENTTPKYTLGAFLGLAGTLSKVMINNSHKTQKKTTKKKKQENE